MTAARALEAEMVIVDTAVIAASTIRLFGVPAESPTSEAVQVADPN